MKEKNKLLLLTSFFLFLSCLIFLVSGSEMLLLLLIKNPEIPLGNLTTAIGLIAFPIWVYLAFQLNKNTPPLILKFLKFNVVLNILWWPIGRNLSGNWKNSFKNIPEKSELFKNYTFLILGITLVIILFYFILLIYKRITQKTLF